MCSTDVVPVKDAAKFANAQGVIGQTAGTLVAPPVSGRLLSAEGQAVTGAATYTVTG